jgi:GNAT superfamily N-acetyltransferase
MQFKELLLPDFITEYSDSTVLRALRLYADLHADTQPDDIESLDESLDNFTGQRTFIALDADSRVQAVGNYALRPDVDYAWLEGLVVSRQQRGAGIGRYMINNLVNVAIDDEREAIQLRSTASAQIFYEGLGFDYVGIPTVNPLMRLDISR